MSLSSGDDLVPPLVLPHVPSTSVKASSDVLTLTITLKTFGTVLYPPEIATFRPANSCDDADFEAFVNICHSTVSPELSSDLVAQRIRAIECS